MTSAIVTIIIMTLISVLVPMIFIGAAIGNKINKNDNYFVKSQENINSGGAFSPIKYNKSLKQLSDDFVNEEFQEHSFGSWDSIPSLEFRRTIYTVIYAVIAFISIMLFMFRISYLLSGFLLVVSSIIFLASYFKVDIYGMLYKEFNARQDEDMEYIISAFIQNKVSRIPFTLIRVVIIVCMIIGPFILFNKPKMFYEHADGGYVIRFYAGYIFPEEVVVPDTYNGEPIIGIRGNVFKNLKTVRSIKLPDTITEINGHAFEKDIMLTSIQLPKNLKYLGAHAFDGCDLETIEIPSGVKSIEAYTFANNSGLKTITFNSDSVSIGAHAFSNDYELKEVLNAKINYIGAYAFEYTKINSIKLDDNMEEIHEAAFKDSGILEITLPKELKKIGPSAFENSSLRDIKFNDNLEEISESAFKASKLVMVTIPDSVTRISAHAFRDCESLIGVQLPSKITEIRTSTFRNTGLTSVIIPNSVTTIGDNAFSYCYNLNSVTIPKSLRTIGEKAFRNCTNLRDITIPRGTSIGKKAFDGSPTKIKYYN